MKQFPSLENARHWARGITAEFCLQIDGLTYLWHAGPYGQPEWDFLPYQLGVSRPCAANEQLRRLERTGQTYRTTLRELMQAAEQVATRLERPVPKTLEEALQLADEIKQL